MPESSRTILYSREEIQRAVSQIAKSILSWIQSEGVEELTLVSVLEGARPFARDLVKELGILEPERTVTVHEIKVQGTAGTQLLENRELSGELPLPASLKGRSVMVVDDLIDSGKTLVRLKDHLRGMGAAQVKTAVLVRKFADTGGPVDFCGFDLKLDRRELAKKGLRDYWLFGYGMDLDGKDRDQDHIGWVEIRGDKGNLPRMNTDERG